MFKKLLLATLVVGILSTMSISTFAASNVGESTIKLDSYENTSSTETLSGVTRGLELPTSSHNLDKSNYSAELQLVGKSWLYTNKFFYPNGDGKLNVSLDVSTTNENSDLTIGFYDLTSDELVTSYSLEDVTSSGTTKNIYAYNLTPSHKYAVCFKAHPYAISGSAVISH